MELIRLEAFVHVVEMGSFSRAAEAMFLSQPTVSAHIKTLETALGSQLITRSTKQASPTEIGTILYGYAKQMITLRDQAVIACRQKAKPSQAIVALSSSSVPCQHVLPQALSIFRAQHPDISFAISRTDSAGVVDMLLAKQAEVGLVGTYIAHEMLHYTPFMEDMLVLIAPDVPPYSELSDSELVRSLRDFPFVIREPGSGTRRETEAMLKRLGVRMRDLRIAAQMDDPDALLRAVQGGLGVSIVSALSAQSIAGNQGVRILHPLGAQAGRSLYLVYHKGRGLSAAAKEFSDYIVSAPWVSDVITGS